MHKFIVTLSLLLLVGLLSLSPKPVEAASNSWMCRTWHSHGWTYTHCTRYWHWHNGVQISDDAWVPNFTIESQPVKYANVQRVPTSSGNSYLWGQCTYGAAALAHNSVNNLGDARNWAYNARNRGMAVGTSPVAGSTVVFPAGYHVSNFGTGTGHVAHVDAVSGNMIEITEMNNSYYGGFGRYDTIWLYAIPGVVEYIY